MKKAYAKPLQIKIIAILSIVGMSVTAWLVYLHYKTDALEFCNFNAHWNCEIVNKSKWSVINIGFIKIPVGILGFFSYLALFIGSVSILRQISTPKNYIWLNTKNIFKVMEYVAYVGLLFSLYLTCIEAFVLHTVCLFCMIQQLMILLISVICLTIRVVVR